METNINDERISRVRYLIEELGLKNRDFAERIGVDNSNLSKYLKGKLPINDSFVNRMVVSLGVSKQWVMQGTDIPFPKESNIPVASVAPGDALQSTPQGTPVYDIDVTAGAMPRSLLFANEQIIGSINLPDVISSSCRVVRVSGDSMAPVIHNGDYVALRELSNMQQIFWGQIYVVLLDDYRLIKFLRRHSDPSKVILRSANPNYDDMEVDRSDIHELMLVQHILHLDSRM
ncbi:MAG: S24 family peptidase [Muribaculaceae bacterium]